MLRFLTAGESHGQALVAMQSRLELAGIRSTREEGVECCYAKQTKFWVTDPDGTLWEVYTLEGDIDHRGAGQSVDAMVANGKPVIATGYSGNTDFMDVSNSFPVTYELVELRDNFGPYRAGERWAEPSVDHAVLMMRHVVAHRDHAALLGDAGRQRINRLFTQAAKDRSKAFELKQELDRLGVFKEYEDRFLDLFKHTDET